MPHTFANLIIEVPQHQWGNYSASELCALLKPLFDAADSPNYAFSYDVNRGSITIQQSGTGANGFQLWDNDAVASGMGGLFTWSGGNIPLSEQRSLNQ